MQHWGIGFDNSQVVADLETALMVGAANGQPVRHLGIAGFGAANISQSDVATAGFESVNFATAGALQTLPDNRLSHEVLINSGQQSTLLASMRFQYLQDPAALLQGFTPDEDRYAVALRVSGQVGSYFSAAIKQDQPFVSEPAPINVVVVADTDVLSDRLWVQQQNFFGQTLTTAWADNGALVVNLLDNLSGSSNLLNIRSRGRFARPFTVVEQLQREAQASYAQSEEALQARLQETEQQLQALQSGGESGGALLLSPEQEQALLNFQQQKLEIRKQLREVSHKLVQDIESLGSKLKFINIFLLPFLLTLCVFAINKLQARRQRGAL